MSQAAHSGCFGMDLGHDRIGKASPGSCDLNTAAERWESGAGGHCSRDKPQHKVVPREMHSLTCTSALARLKTGNVSLTPKGRDGNAACCGSARGCRNVQRWRHPPLPLELFPLEQFLPHFSSFLGLFIGFTMSGWH